MAPVMLRLLRSLREFLLGQDDLINFRVWTALTPTIMKGLPLNGMPSTPQSVAAFLADYRFSSPQDEMLQGSGFSPLIVASLSGNIVVAKELLTRDDVSVNARLQIDMPRFGIEKGMDALTFAAAGCADAQVYEMVSLLLAAGANCNSTCPRSRVTTLMSAIGWQNVEGVRALISSAAGQLDLEKGIRANNATALLLAGIMGTFEIVQTLIEAGANREHK